MVRRLGLIRERYRRTPPFHRWFGGERLEKKEAKRKTGCNPEIRLAFWWHNPISFP